VVVYCGRRHLVNSRLGVDVVGKDDEWSYRLALSSGTSCPRLDSTTKRARRMKVVSKQFKHATQQQLT